MIESSDENAISKSIRNDAEFERILEEYKKVIQQLKEKAVKKYGYKAEKWFGI